MMGGTTKHRGGGGYMAINQDQSLDNDMNLVDYFRNFR